jgi:hypothetical protein
MLLASSMNLVRADQQVGAQFNQPIHINANISESGCNNSPGPQITLSGEISLGGLGVQLLFENNVKGTHQTVVTFATNVVLIPAGQKIVIPKQPVLGGVGGNPLIWLQFIDDSGKSLTDPIFLGRCVQGLTIPRDLLNSSIAGLLVASAGCDNNPGPYITFGGGVGLAGLKARFIFQNNLDGTHTATAVSEVSLIPSGSLVKIPKQPVLGGSGGNPLVFIQLLQGNGTPIGDLEFLGRCNQL